MHCNDDAWIEQNELQTSHWIYVLCLWVSIRKLVTVGGGVSMLVN